ncbi:DUF1178 family protein [Parvularcula sp. LCG005]|uniref:DUF1178 family protein n=1 Tax=Parvularcula sp. LCG005 TaxID=3078805 RepID=UPI002941D642|nr:DUF1178 family protein [Parvularcula sp. LCG005]WOI52451.1 DUF1178 family protein [Parvularcula sp. LCG005]
MIKYALKCEDGHGFEGWFSNSADYDEQAEKHLLECPVCGTAAVEKALMAPSISTSRRTSSAPNADAVLEAFNESARRAKDYVEKNFDHVGKQFPEEARRIHYGETKDRPIYGEASPKEVSELREEGVTVAPLPEPIDAGAQKRKLN